MFNISLLAFCATLSAPGLQGAPPVAPPDDETKAVVSWAKKTAIPIKTVEAESGLEDLERAKSIVGDARIVGMGEATHGTHENCEMKHRMLEFLVKEKGFNIFGLEGTYSECLPINEYVLTGKGDPQQLLRNLGYWSWETEEMLGLIEWMRKYNEDPNNKRKLKFYGFDMTCPAYQAEASLNYLHKAKPELADALRADLKILLSDVKANANFNNYLNASAEERAATKESLKKLLRAYDENKNALVEKLGQVGYEQARQTAVTTIQGEEDLSNHLNSRAPTKEEIDMSTRTYQSSIPEVEALKANMSSELQKRVDGLLKEMKRKLYFAIGYYTQYSDEERLEWKRTVEMLKTSKDSLVRGLSSDEAAKATQAIDDIGAMLRFQDAFATRYPDNYRDICMANNISWILKTEGPDSKIMTWSHNLHASKAVVENPGGIPTQWMGKYIEEQWGNKYVAIGFCIFSGSYQAYYIPPKGSKDLGGVNGFYFENSPPDSVDYAFSLVGYPMFLLDTRKSTDAEVQKWLDTPLRARSLDAIYNDPSTIENGFFTVPLAKAYDAVIFIRDTTRTTPTALGRKWWRVTDLTPRNPKPDSL